MLGLKQKHSITPHSWLRDGEGKGRECSHYHAQIHSTLQMLRSVPRLSGEIFARYNRARKLQISAHLQECCPGKGFLDFLPFCRYYPQIRSPITPPRQKRGALWHGYSFVVTRIRGKIVKNIRSGSPLAQNIMSGRWTGGEQFLQISAGQIRYSFYLFCTEQISQKFADTVQSTDNPFICTVLYLPSPI